MRAVSYRAVVALALASAPGLPAALAQSTVPVPAAASARPAVPDAAMHSPLAAATLRDFSWVSDPRWSPDGRRLAFVRTVVDAATDGYASDLWLAEDGAEPRPLTADPADDLQPRWSPDGTRLAFVSRRSGKAQVHVLDLRGGDSWQLTAAVEGVGAYAWSPDGARVAYVAAVAVAPGSATAAAGSNAPAAAGTRAPRDAPPPFVTDRLRTRNDGTAGWLPAQRRQLFVVELAAGPKAPGHQVTGGDYDHGEPAWSADGTRLYFAAVRRPDADFAADDTEIYAVPARGGAEPVALTDRRGPDSNPTVSPDGRWLAYTGYDEADPPNSYEVTQLHLLDLASGATRRLAVDLDRSVGDGTISDMGAPRGDGQRLAWRADSRAVWFTTADRGQAQLVEATLDGRHRVLTALAAGEVRAFDATARGRVAVVHSGPTQPPELRAFAARDAARESAWTAVTRFNAPLAARHGFVDYEEFWYESGAPHVVDFPGRSGPRQWIQGWILKPPGFDPARRYPLVLYVHGGPHAMYGTGFFHEFQVLAHAGYVVLITNPRGSTGYGQAFGDVIQYAYPGDDHHDLMAGVDALLARGYVDPARLHVGGGSGGGLLTAWAIAHTDRFRKALVERAVTNWHAFVGTADLNRFFATRWFRDWPWRDSADYLARSPLTHVDRVRTPVLVLHNQEDYRTALDQGLQYYAALRMLGRPAELAVFPESSHGMSRDGRPSQRVRRLELILDWFGR